MIIQKDDIFFEHQPLLTFYIYSEKGTDCVYICTLKIIGVYLLFFRKERKLFVVLEVLFVVVKVEKSVKFCICSMYIDYLVYTLVYKNFTLF